MRRCGARCSRSGRRRCSSTWHRHPRRRFHPFDVPEDLPEQLKPVGDALAFLRKLHARRNHCPAAETLGRLLEHTRAHVTFVMRPAGERVLANVLQVVELARQYEADGGISFRGFVDALREAAERSEAPEAPVVEEGSDGVRLMTVHKAKGLEFPVVVLADITCKLSRADASRHIDAARGLCAMPLIGCSPWDLHRPRGRGGARATPPRASASPTSPPPAPATCSSSRPSATRRTTAGCGTLEHGDLPGALEAPRRGGCPGLSRLRAARTPSARAPRTTPACEATPCARACTGWRRGTPWGLTLPVIYAPGSDPRWSTFADVAPGLQPRRQAPEPGARSPEPITYPVVWWTPYALSLDREAPVGLRREDLISKDVSASVVADARTRYDSWVLSRADAIADGSAPSLQVRTITEFAHAGAWPASLGEMPPVEVIELPRDGTRPKGRRFGILVHAVLATTPLDADLADAHRARDARRPHPRRARTTRSRPPPRSPPASSRIRCSPLRALRSRTARAAARSRSR